MVFTARVNIKGPSAVKIKIAVASIAFIKLIKGLNNVYDLTVAQFIFLPNSFGIMCDRKTLRCQTELRGRALLFSHQIDVDTIANAPSYSDPTNYCP